MKIRLLIVFVLIIVIPIVGLGWLGVKTMRDEREIVKHRVQNFIKQELAEIDTKINNLIKQYERNLYSLYYNKDYSVYGLRQIISHSPYINQLLVLDRNDRQVFPSPFYANVIERKFLARSKQLMSFFSRPDELIGWNQPNTTRALKAKRRGLTQKKAVQSNQQRVAGFGLADSNKVLEFDKMDTRLNENRRWKTWFWENGLQLMYWYRSKNGYLIAIEVSRAKLIFDIISLLPTTQSDQKKGSKSLITLNDAGGRLIYKWGHYQPEQNEKPLSSLDLSAPLNTWTLKYYSKAPVLSASINYLPILFGMSTAILAMIGLAFYFYRENNRELIVAKQRVTFVNQVSHELKTPLTNIRMYAELLENELDTEDTDPKAQNRVNIIVNESQRLSRLISNVLNFARQQKETLKINKSLSQPDTVIQSVIEQFGPTFKREAIEVEFEPGVKQEVYLDADFLEQIIHNLFSNIEKYAADGHYLGIKTRIVNDQTVEIIVKDKGPGIPKAVADRIFEAFYRIDTKLTEGVSGTGIGLSIARELARLHGGDLYLAQADIGATFVLTLNIEKA